MRAVPGHNALARQHGGTRPADFADTPQRFGGTRPVEFRPRPGLPSGWAAAAAWTHQLAQRAWRLPPVRRRELCDRQGISDATFRAVLRGERWACPIAMAVLLEIFELELRRHPEELCGCRQQ